MSDPNRDTARCIFPDGHEIEMARCINCHTLTFPGYVCPGCEAKRYREAAKEVRAQMALLSVALDKWER
jgi:uncharacterized paraquat-inducible protein A